MSTDRLKQLCRLARKEAAESDVTTSKILCRALLAEIVEAVEELHGPLDACNTCGSTDGHARGCFAV